LGQQVGYRHELSCPSPRSQTVNPIAGMSVRPAPAGPVHNYENAFSSMDEGWEVSYIDSLLMTEDNHVP
jgi:hypothetical protein